VAKWVADNIPFDRMYFYGSAQPVHISFGPQMCRQVTAMIPDKKTGRRVPRNMTIEKITVSSSET
jgi:hypothetical protein